MDFPSHTQLILSFQDLIPPTNGSLHVHVETFIFEVNCFSHKYLFDSNKSLIVKIANPIETTNQLINEFLTTIKTDIFGLLEWYFQFPLTLSPFNFQFQVSKIDDISLTMTFELYMDLMWEESRLIINETSPYWGPDGSFMGSTNFVPKMWLPDIQIYMCKQFRKRQIVTDVAGLIIFKNRKVLYTVSTEVRITYWERKNFL